MRTAPVVSALLIAIASCGTPRSSPTQHPQATPEARLDPGPPASPAPPATPPASSGPPATAKRPATDTYHGVKVEDPYQWLEADSTEVTAWNEAQAAYARRALDRLPEIEALRTELRKILTSPTAYYFEFKPAGGKLFGMRIAPPKQQPELIVLDDPERADSAKVVLDPTTRPGGVHQTIDWFVPSPDGKKVAVSLSEKGSEAGTLHVIDLSGKDLEPPIPNVQRGTGGGDMAWTNDSKGLYYTRYPAAGEKPEPERDFWLQVWFHALGSTKDRYELGKDLPKVAEIMLDTDARGRVLVSVQNGDSGVFQHHLRDARGKWRQLTDWNDQVVFVGFGPTSDLWMVSRKGAPRGQIMRLPGAATKLEQARVVVKEGKDAIVTDYYSERGILATKDRIYVTYQVGGPSELRAYTLAGKAAKAPAIPPVSSVGEPTAWKDGVIVNASSYTTPPTFYKASSKTGATHALAALSPKPPVDLSGATVQREHATSKDGTKVPLNIVWPKGAPRDGSVPCEVTGYGGFSVSSEPGFLLTKSVLISRGVCFVEVNMRGGGEFGEEWHRAGMLTRKQNVFDDFAAALTYLVDQKYTSRDRIAITGGSNGGLLMGAMITQHPDLMKAVVSRVGIYDMLRVERSSNGQYNVPEYGSVADPEQFKALYAYSPYHHVVANTRYPAILFMTGANDPRVAPWHSRKMIAALQAANAGDNPILLRTSGTTGHGAGTALDEVVIDVADSTAFILSQIKPR